MNERPRPPPRAAARAVLLLWLFRATSGLAVAYPAARTIGAFLPPAYPMSDGLLFAPGGIYAVEALRLGGRAIQASLEGSGLVFVLVAIVASFPLAVALCGLMHPNEGVPSLARRGAAAMPALVALGGATALLQAVGLVVVAAAVNALSGSLDSVLDERRADLCLAAGAFAAGLPLGALGIGHDLARAAVIRHGARARAAAAIALRVLRRTPGAAISPWLLPAAASVVLVAAAAWATGVLDVSRPGALRVVGVAVIHQATIVGLIVLRLLWLERALRLVDPPPRLQVELSAAATGSLRPLLVDTPERSDAPDDPTPNPAA